jgi:glucosamine 6-phosphate synthetase-like amidotransferase/phosphosugar isomerase protein
MGEVDIMCGIIGILGKSEVASLLFDGLKTAGISWL